MQLIRPVALCVVASLWAGGSLAAGSLCKKGEINFSTCSVGRKTASFCIKKGDGSEPDTLQYRFGMPNRLEMIFPSEPRKSHGLFFNSMRTYTDGAAEMRLSFRSGDYHYIFFNIDSTRGDSRGIYVLRNGGLIKTLPCSDPRADQVPVPAGLIENEEFYNFQ